MQSFTGPVVFAFREALAAELRDALKLAPNAKKLRLIRGQEGR